MLPTMIWQSFASRNAISGEVSKESPLIIISLDKTQAEATNSPAGPVSPMGPAAPFSPFSPGVPWLPGAPSFPCGMTDVVPSGQVMVVAWSVVATVHCTESCRSSSGAQADVVRASVNRTSEIPTFLDIDCTPLNAWCGSHARRQRVGNALYNLEARR